MLLACSFLLSVGRFLLSCGALWSLLSSTVFLQAAVVISFKLVVVVVVLAPAISLKLLSSLSVLSSSIDVFRLPPYEIR